MGKIMEAVFCVFYLVFTGIVGIQILKKSNGRFQSRLWGIMTLVLVGGDAFHLVPRIFAAVNPSGNFNVSLGIGKMITSITMTLFYLLLYFFYEAHYKKRDKNIRLTVMILALVRIILCFLPQNDWTGAAPVIWGVIRNVPFTIMGLMMVWLFFKEQSDKNYRWMSLAILLSFAFYLPVVLWADVSPMIGMLMLPKTCMYMWIVMMGYRQVSSSKK